MGQIMIEIPQGFNRHYEIHSNESAEEFLSYLDDLASENEAIEIVENNQMT